MEKMDDWKNSKSKERYKRLFKLIDDVIIEVHSENSDFIEGIAKLPIKTFRGMYILHTFYSMIDKKVDEKVQELLSQKISKYQEEEALKKRK